jgi:hypothetical protein
MAEDPEISAMSKVSAALAGIDDEARGRVIDWAAKKYGVVLNSFPRLKGHGEGVGIATQAEDGDGAQIPFVDLFDRANPVSDPDRALVGGFWFQETSGHPSFDAQKVNNALKDVGHGIGNITQAFNALQRRQPALVRQLAKSGKAKQARKTYKLTTAGVSAVGRMLSPTKTEE